MLKLTDVSDDEKVTLGNTFPLIKLRKYAEVFVVIARLREAILRICGRLAAGRKKYKGILKRANYCRDFLGLLARWSQFATTLDFSSTVSSNITIKFYFPLLNSPPAVDDSGFPLSNFREGDGYEPCE